MLNNLKPANDPAKTKLYEEIKEITKNNEDLNNKCKMLEIEKSELEKKIDYFNKNSKKE